MRKWHRWLSVIFAVFLFWIAGTGVLSHLSGWSREEPAAEVAPPPGFVCPEGWRCTPPRPGSKGFGALTGFFHHLHSGEEFGKAGEAVSFLSGLALLFFSFSGLWLYIRMWRDRARRAARQRWFWK